MSGGVAYGYDPDGELPPTQLGDGRTETSTRMIATGCTAPYKCTSTLLIPLSARRILSDWSGQQRHFVKVMPRDYKRSCRRSPG